MTTVLTIILVVLMGLTVFSLVRGVIAFLKTTKIDLNSPRGGETASEMQLMQNRMMMNRIKYQALAIAVVAILLVMTR
jgi:hypothetical protein